MPTIVVVGLDVDVVLIEVVELVDVVEARVVGLGDGRWSSV